MVHALKTSWVRNGSTTFPACWWVHLHAWWAEDVWARTAKKKKPFKNKAQGRRAEDWCKVDMSHREDCGMLTVRLSNEIYVFLSKGVSFLTALPKNTAMNETSSTSKFFSPASPTDLCFLTQRSILYQHFRPSSMETEQIFTEVGRLLSKHINEEVTLGTYWCLEFSLTKSASLPCHWLLFAVYIFLVLFICFAICWVLLQLVLWVS